MAELSPEFQDWLFKRDVAKLPVEAAKILYLKCQDRDRTVSAVTNEFNRRWPHPESRQDPHKRYTSNHTNVWLADVYKILKIEDGFSGIDERVCRLFHEIAGEEPDWDNWPPPVPSIPPELRPEAEIERSPEPEEEPDASISGPRQQQRAPNVASEEPVAWRRTLAAILLIALLILGFWRLVQLVVWDCNPFASDLACGITAAGADVRPTDEASSDTVGPNETPKPTATSLVETQQADETGQSPTEQPTEVAEIATAEEPTATPSVTPSPSSTPTKTPRPTSTPTSTITPTPTVTPNVFIEDFDDADFSEWNSVVGEPIIVNGELKGENDTRWFMGDSTWRNYSIEFRYTHSGCANVPSNRLGVRYQDDGEILSNVVDSDF